MPPMPATPSSSHMNSGAQNAYMQLQAMPSAAPHIELPLYQNEYAGMANGPDRANMGKAELIRSAWVIAGSALPSPPIAVSTGKITAASSTPAVSCLIAIPIRWSISAVPKPATHPSKPHPTAANSANAQAIAAAGPMEVTLAPPMSTPAARHMAIPRADYPLSRCLNMTRPSMAPTVTLRAAIGTMTPGSPACVAALSAMT